MEDGEWQIRKGNYITLADLFRFGARQVPCFHLYRMYQSLDIYIHRRNHSVSTNDNAVDRGNANVLRRKETGLWGLPDPGAPWLPEKKRKRR